MTRSLSLLAAALLSQLLPATSVEADGRICPALVASDQFGKERRLSFPADRPVLLFIADQEGLPEVGNWPAEAKRLLGDGVSILGVARLEGVSSWLAPVVRKRIRAAHKHPVLLDWDGIIGRFAGHEPGRAQLVLLDRTGAMVQAALSPFNKEHLAMIAAEAARQASPSAPAARQ